MTQTLLTVLGSILVALVGAFGSYLAARVSGHAHNAAKEIERLPALVDSLHEMIESREAQVKELGVKVESREAQVRKLDAKLSSLEDQRNRQRRYIDALRRKLGNHRLHYPNPSDYGLDFEG